MTYLPFVTIFSGRFLHSLRARVTQYGFTFVTICFQLVLYTLRARVTQYRSTGVLGRCV